MSKEFDYDKVRHVTSVDQSDRRFSLEASPSCLLSVQIHLAGAKR